MEEGDEKLFKQFERWGELKVRADVAIKKYPEHAHTSALRWLRGIDEARERAAADIAAEQLEIARSAKDAAWAAAKEAERASSAAERASSAAERQAAAAERADTKALIAIIIAIVSAATAIASIIVPHYWK
ncbi:hypothetical protein [Methylocystis parvus]|uniref:hypothetical protein n=1 Tax=Methylocystis parvus TaxID=134 RepID=UPI003C7140DB